MTSFGAALSSLTQEAYKPRLTDFGGGKNAKSLYGLNPRCNDLPADFLSSKMLGEKCLTLYFTALRRLAQPRTAHCCCKPSSIDLRHTGLLDAV